MLSAITDIINKIQTGSTITYCRVWNNQFQYLEHQAIESFPFPCAFVEVKMPGRFSQLSQGITESDMVIRLHIGTNQLNAPDGTMEQNLSVFALRDELITLLTAYTPAQCSPLQKITEYQDYTHSNIYHYIIEYQCSLIDTTAYLRNKQTPYGPPVTLQVNTDIIP